MVAYRRSATPVLVYGIDPVEEARISVVENYLARGLLSRLGEEGSGIILGRGVAAEIGVETGQYVNLFIPAAGTQDRTPKLQPLPVLGLLESGTELDNTLALLNLEAASQLSSFPGRVSGLRLQVENIFCRAADYPRPGAQPARRILQLGLDTHPRQSLPRHSNLEEPGRPAVVPDYRHCRF